MSSNSTDSITFGDEYVCSINERKYQEEVNECNRISNNEKYKLKRFLEDDSESFKEERIVDSGIENSERDDDEKCEIVRNERTKSVIEEMEKYAFEGEEFYSNSETPKSESIDINLSVFDYVSELILRETDHIDIEDLEKLDIHELTKIKCAKNNDNLISNEIRSFKENRTEANYDMSLTALSKRKQKQSKKKTKAELKPCSEQKCDSKKKGRQVTNLATAEIAKDCSQELNYLRENSTCEINHNGLSMSNMSEKEQLTCSNSIPLSEVKPKMNAKTDFASASIIRSQVELIEIDDQNECNYETTDSFDKSKEQVVKEGCESKNKKKIMKLSETKELNNSKKRSNKKLEVIKRILSGGFPDSESLSLKKRKLRNEEVDVTYEKNGNSTVCSTSGNSYEMKSRKNSKDDAFTCHLYKEVSKQNGQNGKLTKSQFFKNIEAFNLDEAYENVKKANDKYLKSILNFKIQYGKFVKANESLELSADHIVNNCVESIAEASIAYAHWIKEQNNDLNNLVNQINDVDTFLKESI